MEKVIPKEYEIRLEDGELEDLLFVIKDAYQDVRLLAEHITVVLNRLDPNNVQTILDVPVDAIRHLFAFFEKNKEEYPITRLGMFARPVIESLLDLRDKKGIIKEAVVETGDDSFHSFLIEFYKQTQSLNIDISQKKQELTNILSWIEGVQKQLNSSTLIPNKNLTPPLDRDDEMEYMYALNLFFPLIDHYEEILADRKAKLKKAPTDQEKETEARENLKELYKIELPNVPFQDIIEVLNASKNVGCLFLERHQEVYTSSKDTYLHNLEILKKRGIDISLVVLTDPDALLLDSKVLEKTISFVEMYGSVGEILLCQPHALSDTSYFSILDLMIEHDCLDIEALQDSEHSELLRKMSLDLLELPTTLFSNSDSFFLSKDQIRLLIQKNECIKVEGEISKETLEAYQENNLAYQIGNIKISRPKVLRLERDIISINQLFENSYMKEETMYETIEYLKACQKEK